MAVGDQDHRKSEYFDNEIESWISINDYPYSVSVSSFDIKHFDISVIPIPLTERNFFGYASVVIDQQFFIIGGAADGNESTMIASLDPITWSWSNVGRLRTARDGHEALWLNSKLIVVGGQYTKPVEFCELENDRFFCTSQALTLKDFDYYPLLFAVSDDYNRC